MNIRLLSCTLALLCTLFTQLGQAQVINRGPYLQSVYQDHITIKWRTDDPTSSKLWYGNSPTNLTQIISTPFLVKNHEVLISNLVPNTVYYYAVGNETGPLVGGDTNHFFKTNPLENSQAPVRMWVLCDPGFGNNNQRETRDGFYQYNQGEQLDLILTLGDNAYQDGTDNQYQDAWFENMYEDKLINTPLFLTYGNHDAESADGEDGTGPYFDIFNFPTNAECGGQPSGNESYYSHDYANIHFISLNSYDVEHTLESPMIQWLEDDLASNTLDWTVFMIHHPFYDGQQDNLSDYRTRNTNLRENIVPLLDQYGVDLVLMGHSHTYQRSYLINGHYDTSNTFDPSIMGIDMGDGQIDGDGAYKKIDGKGIPYVVCGTSAYSQTNEDLNHAIMYHNELSMGSIFLELSYDKMDYKYITSDGMVSDYFTIQKDLEYTVYDCPDQLTNFGVNCDDNNEYTYQDTINTNCDCAGTAYDCPAFLADIGTACDDNNPDTYIDLITANCECAGTPMFNPGTTTVTVNQHTDDAEEYANGTIKLFSSDLELVEDNSRQTVGIRFNHSAIPSGAILVSAHLQFTVDQTDDKPTNLKIYGEASSNPLPFENIDYNITNRIKTNTSVDWSVMEWATVNDANLAQRSPNILPIINEMIGSPDLSGVNAMSFIIEGTGKRVAIAYDGDPSGAAQLILNYAYDCTDSDGDGVCDAEDSCPSVAGFIGSACDDGNSLTYQDVLNESCNCLGTPYDCPTFLSNIGSPCDDGNPATVNDVLLSNCQCEGVPPTFDCPALAANIGDACNDNNPETENDIITAGCNCSGSVPANASLVIPIRRASDDAEERTNGNVSLYSSDLELVVDNGKDQVIGLRFDQVNLPLGSEIVDAYIQFTGDQDSYEDPCVLNIYGERSGSSTTFLAESENITARPKTLMFTQWNPTTVWAEDDVTMAQRTPDLSNIIEEIMTVDDYTSNSPLTFIISGYGSRVASSFDKEESVAAVLIINYSFTCVDPDEDGICSPEDACPYLAGVPGSPCNDNNPITINDMIDENCNCLGSTPSGFACSQIITGNDDAEERVDGRVKLHSSDLELTKDANEQTIGLRFTELFIPPSIPITNARIQFTVDETKNEPGTLSIYGQLSSNPQNFIDEDYDISDRALTNNVITWTPNEWLAVDESGPDQQSPDLSPILQEIVNQENYDANNPIVLIIQGDGKRVAKSFDGNEPEDAAQLCVDYDISSMNSNANEYQDHSEIETVASSLSNNFSIFPNPAKGHLSLNFDRDNFEGTVIVNLIDGLGKRVLRKEQIMELGQRNLRFEVLNLPNGFYTVQVTKGGLVTSGKVVILK